MQTNPTSTAALPAIAQPIKITSRLVTERLTGCKSLLRLEGSSGLMTEGELSTFSLERLSEELTLIEKILAADPIEGPAEIAGIVEPLLGLDNFHKDVQGPEQLVNLWVMFFADKPRWVAIETVRKVAMKMRRRPMPADLQEHMPAAWTRVEAARSVLNNAKAQKLKQAEEDQAQAQKRDTERAERLASLSQQDRQRYDTLMAEGQDLLASTMLIRKPKPPKASHSPARPVTNPKRNIAAHLGKIKASLADAGVPVLGRAA